MKMYAVTVTRVVVEETTMHITATCAAQAKAFGRQDAKHAYYSAVDVTYCPDVIACELVPPPWPDEEPRTCADCGKTRDDVRLRINLGDRTRLLCAACFSERPTRR